jgi:hypothetical protein
MTQRHAMTVPERHETFSGLELLLNEMQALAQVIPGFGTGFGVARRVIKPADEAEFDNMPV